MMECMNAENNCHFAKRLTQTKVPVGIGSLSVKTTTSNGLQLLIQKEEPSILVTKYRLE